VAPGELSGQAPASTSVEDKELREEKKCFRERKIENEFLKKAVAFFTKSL
jgi:hypothetical protein